MLVLSTTAPENPIEGDIYYNTIESNNYIFQSGEWKSLTFRSDIWTDIKQSNRKNKINKVFNG